VGRGFMTEEEFAARSVALLERLGCVDMGQFLKFLHSCVFDQPAAT
jgi:hypothetical protein